jgi:hypothetical protein
MEQSIYEQKIIVCVSNSSKAGCEKFPKFLKIPLEIPRNSNAQKLRMMQKNSINAHLIPEMQKVQKIA